MAEPAEATSNEEPMEAAAAVESTSCALTEYRLSRVIAAHVNDVKSISSTLSGAIISGSRDERVKLFVERNSTYVESLALNNKHVVNAVAFFLCRDESSLIFCGRKNGSIAVYNTGRTEPQHILQGHDQNVCVLQVSDEACQLISGSWDANAVVWSINELLAERTAQFRLIGHKHSIWAAAFIPQKRNFFLTASADRTINLWRESVPVRTYSGHEDVVRSLVVLSPEQFISASNDSTLRVWNARTQRSYCYESQTREFIYSMIRVKTPDGRDLIVNGGENGYLEFWELKEGADASETTLTHAQMGRAPASSLWSLRALPGGDVAAATNTGYIQCFRYTFTARPERVAPDDVADAFDADIAVLITSLAQQKARQAAQNGDSGKLDGGGTDDDPYAAVASPYDTGSVEQFAPGTIGAAAAAAGAMGFENGGGDPYTSAGRYVPGQEVSVYASNSLAAPDKRRPRSDLVPVRAFYIFGRESASTKAREALRVANAQLTPELYLDEQEIDALDELLARADIDVTEAHERALEKALMQWPFDVLVPVLDSFRLGLLNARINEYFCSTKSDGGRGELTLRRLSMLLISEPPAPVRILVARSLANAAQHEAGRQMLQQNMSELTALLAAQLVAADAKAALQIAAASFLANLSLILLRQTENGQMAELGPREDILRAVIKQCEGVSTFSGATEQALLRLLQTLVTLMWGDATVIQTGKQRGVVAVVSRIKDAVQTDDIKSVARDIYVMTTTT